MVTNQSEILMPGSAIHRQVGEETSKMKPMSGNIGVGSVKNVDARHICNAGCDSDVEYINKVGYVKKKKAGGKAPALPGRQCRASSRHCTVFVNVQNRER